jgi:hypothetical protein
MTVVRMKPEYGPTLGTLLAPRWQAASRAARWSVIGAGVALLALALAAGLTLETPTYARGGSVPFSFSYRGLYRVAHEQGGYVKVQRDRADGALEDSYAVAPLRLPPYAGELTGELPVYAASYIPLLRRRLQDFVLQGEGKAKVNGVYGYAVFYTALVDGQTVWGRNVMLLPERKGVREGVVIEMLTSSLTSSEVTTPMEVGSAGILARPLKTFAFG